MTLAQAVNALLFLIWPLMIGLACLWFYYRVMRMATHQRLALEQFARMSVEKVQHQNGEMRGQAKKALAISETAQLFAAFQLPSPPPIAVDIALESAVFRMKIALKTEKDNVAM